MYCKLRNNICLITDHIHTHNIFDLTHKMKRLVIKTSLPVSLFPITRNVINNIKSSRNK